MAQLKMIILISAYWFGRVPFIYMVVTALNNNR